MSLRPASCLVVVAASTGGPAAVEAFLRAFSHRSDACVCIVQHMPQDVLEGYAARLARTLGPRVAMGGPGTPLIGGSIVVVPAWGEAVVVPAPAGRGAMLSIRPRPPSAGPRPSPSADAALASAARCLGPRVCGVVLSGMGDDGCEGARHVVAAGGAVFVQDEASSIVWGMPGACVAAGLATDCAPPAELARRVTAWLDALPVAPAA